MPPHDGCFSASRRAALGGVLRRALPRFLTLRDPDQTRIGPLTSIHVSVTSASRPPRAANWPSYSAQAGAGLLFDRASHCLDLLDFLLAPVASAPGFPVSTAAPTPPRMSRRCSASTDDPRHRHLELQRWEDKTDILKSPAGGRGNRHHPRHRPPRRPRGRPPGPAGPQSAACAPAARSRRSSTSCTGAGRCESPERAAPAPPGCWTVFWGTSAVETGQNQ